MPDTLNMRLNETDRRNLDAIRRHLEATVPGMKITDADLMRYALAAAARDIVQTPAKPNTPDEQ